VKKDLIGKTGEYRAFRKFFMKVGMKVNLLIALLALLPCASRAQEALSTPQVKHSRPDAPGRESAADLPLPEGEAASSAAPSILPESSLLPSAQSLPRPAPDPPISPEQKKLNAKRIAEARISAMGNPRARLLLDEAKAALTIEARRNFLRAFFITVCTQMRKMVPDLRGSITSFEQEQVRRIARSKNLSVTSTGFLAE
jgi:hypothetical protein